MKLDRLSNYELLRILAILFVLIGHVSMTIHMLPNAGDISSTPIESFGKVFLSSLSVGGVDVFVLISGWFGIRATIKGLAKYVYQVFFLLWLILFIFSILDRSALTSDTLKASFLLYNGYWFIMAYLGLYLLAPILNSFVNSVSKKQFQTFLILFYFFQSYFSWITSVVDYFGGYSITLFCILYLTARYIKLYPIRIIGKYSLTVYFVISFFITIIVTLSLRYTGTALRMLRYDNPMIILSSLGLLMAFSKWNFHNKVINRVALSVFAVYIVHFNPFVFPYFKHYVLFIYNSTNNIVTILSLFLFLCVVFLICFLIDQLRIVSWNLLLKKINKCL